MAIRYQYPALAEPVSQDAESVRIDKWYQRTAEPVRTTPQPIRTDYFFFVDFSVPSVVVPALDSWFRQLSEPVRVTPEIVRSYYDVDANLLTQGENITLDKWYQSQLDLPMWKIPDINNFTGSFVIDAESLLAPGAALVTIDGDSTIQLTVQYENVMIGSDFENNKWDIL